MVALAGVAAAVFSVIDALIWSALGATAFASQFADGATWSLTLVGVQTVGTILILLLSIRFGEGAASIADLCLIGIAGLGIVGWALSSEPAVATMFVVLADMIGVVMMLPKTWRDPWSETAPTYVLASASGLCGVLAVGELDASLLLYPSYYAIGNGAIAAVILRRRRSTQTAAA